MTAILPYHTPILRPVLDLTTAAWEHTHGDIKVVGTWWLDTDGEPPWPCMVLVPAHHSLATDRYVPCVVSLDLAWIWSEEQGDAEFAMETAISFCQSLGLSVNWANCYRVASIIRDHLEDLIKIGPRPAALNTVVADVLMQDEHGKERHHELKDAI